MTNEYSIKEGNACYQAEMKNCYMICALTPYEGELDFTDKRGNKWSMDTDPMAGTYFWTCDEYPEMQMFATPFWEDIDGISLCITDTEDVHHEDIIDTINFDLTFDSANDVRNYVYLVSKEWEKYMEVING
jgi:hypothetical protein